MPGPGIPAYGLGMRPLRGPLGRLRDAVLWKVVERTFARSMLRPLNELRRSVGLPEFRSAYRPTRTTRSPYRTCLSSGSSGSSPTAPCWSGPPRWCAPAGRGSPAKAVARGVPVVAVPSGRNQPEVARRIAEAGVGIRLPLKELSADTLRAAVRAARALPAWPTEPDGTAPERFRGRGGGAGRRAAPG